MKKQNVSKLVASEMQKVLMAHMETNMMNLSYNGTITNQWETLCEKVYETSVDTLGYTTRKHQAWFDENDDQILSLLNERRRTHDALLPQQTRNRKQHYANCNLQTKLQLMQNAWWDMNYNSELTKILQKEFFAAIKQVYGSQKSVVAPIRDAAGSHILTEKPAIVSRWRKHFSDLLSCPATAREEALASVNQYPVQEDMANPPTLEEILAANTSIKSRTNTRTRWHTCNC